MSKREIPEVTPCDDAETALDKLRGNWTVDSVEGAMVALSNEHRGLVTLGLFHEGAPPEILRAALETVWQLDYSELWKACRGSIPMVTKIFRAAEFDIDHLPEVSDIWRGASVDQEMIGVMWRLESLGLVIERWLAGLRSAPRAVGSRVSR
jgi:hypothetical protein